MGRPSGLRTSDAVSQSRIGLPSRSTPWISPDQRPVASRVGGWRSREGAVPEHLADVQAHDLGGDPARLLGGRGIAVDDSSLEIDDVDPLGGPLYGGGEETEPLLAVRPLGVGLRALCDLEFEALAVLDQIVPQRDLAHEVLLVKPADEDAAARTQKNRAVLTMKNAGSRTVSQRRIGTT